MPDRFGGAELVGPQRGGWTWYTGSAAWMYRLMLESLLGLRLEADRLQFVPCLPADWEGFEVHSRQRETVYHISVVPVPAGQDRTTGTLDGAESGDPAGWSRRSARYPRRRDFGASPRACNNRCAAKKLTPPRTMPARESTP